MICGDRKHILSDLNLQKLFDLHDLDENNKVPISDVKTLFQVSDSFV